MNDDLFIFIFAILCVLARVFLCTCKISPARPCLSETLLSVGLSMCVRARARRGDEVASAPPPSNQKETLNTSQSVRRAAKIETHPLSHCDTSKLILLTTGAIRSDKWLQIGMSTAQTDAAPSPQTPPAQFPLSAVRLDERETKTAKNTAGVLLPSTFSNVPGLTSVGLRLLLRCPVYWPNGDR